MKLIMQTTKHLVPTLMLGLVILSAVGCKTPQTQARFSTPETAAAALQEALKSESPEKMQTIFGRECMELVASGDPVADQYDREVVALAMSQSWQWSPRGADAQELIIGDERWPFPVPLVKAGNEWRFDSEAGREEVIARRIGANELAIIKLCRGYVKAQQEYASQPHDGKPPGRYAQRLRSTPGLQDGLFWHLKRGERTSPFGELVNAAIKGGYDPNKPDSSPFRGYRFRILAAQGPAAPGGKKSYVVNGEMTGGFALLAYPAEYAFSGIMTFIVGQDGVVYQKDLGDDTDKRASTLAEFNPDKSWTRAESP
jgi:hypothetical protein